MKIYINAGHHDHDSGNQSAGYSEHELNKRIRNEVVKLLPDAFRVPDNLDLRNSIAWVNQSAEPDDLAIDIHLNGSASPDLRGTEAYYSTDSKLAEIFALNVSKALGIPNRGARHDSESFVGSLGWLRKLKCRSVLVEVCYLSSPGDRKVIVFPSGQMAAARGIVAAINELRGTQEKLIALQQLLARMVEELKRLLALLVGRIIS